MFISKANSKLFRHQFTLSGPARADANPCLRHVVLSFLTSKKAYDFKALRKQMQLCWLTTPNIVRLFAHRCFFCCWMLLHKVWKPHHTVMEMVAMLVAQLAVLAASL